MPGLPFVVGDEPFCVWDGDPRDRNLTFLNGVDPTYFAYLAQVHGTQLDVDPQHAAIALRTGYHHALESFFALLFTTVQAPVCVFAWLQKYRISQVRDLVRAVNRAEPVRNKLRLEPPTWETISERINFFRYDDPARLAETRQLFADLWRGFAHDFSIRTTRTSTTASSTGSASGSAASPWRSASRPCRAWRRRRKTCSPSAGATSGPRTSSPSPSRRRTRRRRTSGCAATHSTGPRPPWWPALQLVGMSVKNVLACLKIMHGVRGKDVQFHRPEDAAVFEAPWQDSVGVTHISLDEVLDERAVRLLSKEELLALCDQPTSRSETEPAIAR